MDKKIIFPIVFLLVILALALSYSFSETNGIEDKTSFTVSSEGPFPLSELIEDIKTREGYEGYDNETLAWMESLGDKQVFSGDGIFLIMSDYDAQKIPSEYVTDVFIHDFVDCNVIENHSLGDIKYPKDVFYVKNVVYKGQEIVEIPGGGA